MCTASEASHSSACSSQNAATSNSQQHQQQSLSTTTMTRQTSHDRAMHQTSMELLHTKSFNAVTNHAYAALSTLYAQAMHATLRHNVSISDSNVVQQTNVVPLSEFDNLKFNSTNYNYKIFANSF
jgi:hypothetical protein